VFVLGKPFHPSLMFVGEARSLPYLPANVRLGWKGLPKTKDKNQLITAVKGFIVQSLDLLENIYHSLATGTVYKSLHFLHNLRMGLLS
jgi:hypothetical protein